MDSYQDQIDQLVTKLEALLKRQEDFSKEVLDLRDEIGLLKRPQTEIPTEKETGTKALSLKEVPLKEPSEPLSVRAPKKVYRDINHNILGGVCAGLAEYLSVSRILIRFLWVLISFIYGLGFIAYIILWVVLPKAKKETFIRPQQAQTSPDNTGDEVVARDKTPKIIADWEKFIGENLINKIGIAITIIGVGIGAKYTIEHDLISPLTRIILGYLVGLTLLVFGIRLKEKYEHFSAVLVSGAMAILYFMTYAAYSFYQLFPQTQAFVIMALFTVFTVFTALRYNQQAVALIGLVGAYAVPFLLSDDAGHVAVLFSYMAMINIGILMIAFKKYWKILYFSAFVLTWLIFVTWYIPEYKPKDHFGLALTFLFIFFMTFYATFLSFKLISKEKFETTDILLLLANSFIFYGFGYDILNGHETGAQLLGLFTLGNALIHFIVGLIIYIQKLADKNLFYLVSGLVLVFITIAVPVQLNGNWVTLLWVGEAALLFWIGRTKRIPAYEKISYPLMILAVISILQDWSMAYNTYNLYEPAEYVRPLLNSHFLSSLLFIAAFGWITFLNANEKYPSALSSQKDLRQLTSLFIPAILLSAIYFSFRMEIENFWNQLYDSSFLKINDFEQYSNNDLLHFRTIWVLNYTLLFTALLSFLNIWKLKNRTLGLINLSLNAIAILAFLGQGLYALSELRGSFLERTLAAYYQIGTFHIGIRYVSFAFVAVTLLACYRYIRQEFMKPNLKMAFELLLHLSVLWIASSELINLMELAGSYRSDKLGLSILWGLYSLLLIALGIWKAKKYLRVGAIVLFGVTLIKLFFYDISHLNTISKTIVFLSLGILLLIISFLYNKFKNQIADETEK